MVKKLQGRKRKTLRKNLSQTQLKTLVLKMNVMAKNQSKVHTYVRLVKAIPQLLQNLEKKTVSLQQLLVKHIKHWITMIRIVSMLKDSNLKTQKQQLETIHNLGLVHVLTFLYQKQKLKNLGVKQRCGIINSVQVVKIIILIHMDQVELMSTQRQKSMATLMNKVTIMFILKM